MDISSLTSLLAVTDLHQTTLSSISSSKRSSQPSKRYPLRRPSALSQLSDTGVPALSSVRSRVPSGLHPDTAIQTNHLGVQHAVLNDAAHHLGVLFWPSETLRERHGLCQRRLHLGWQTLQQRRQEQACGAYGESAAEAGFTKSGFVNC